MADIDRRFVALFAAAHAVAETRLGPPYEQVGGSAGPYWTEPDRPLTWKSDEEADELILRLSVGLGTLLGSGMDIEAASSLAARDIEGVCDVLEAREGKRPEQANAVSRMKEAAAQLLGSSENTKAIELVSEQLMQWESLTMHEVDFLVDAADGDPDALDDLERFRSTFSTTRIPWPDHT